MTRLFLATLSLALFGHALATVLAIETSVPKAARVKQAPKQAPTQARHLIRMDHKDSVSERLMDVVAQFGVPTPGYLECAESPCIAVMPGVSAETIGGVFNDTFPDKLIVGRTTIDDHGAVTVIAVVDAERFSDPDFEHRLILRIAQLEAKHRKNRSH